MAKIYRTLKVGMWRDAKFRRLTPMQPSGQALWIYLLTGPHTGPIPGLSECGEAQLAEALGWSMEAFREAFGEVFREGLVKADWKARLMWIPNAPKHNPPTSPNVVKSWATAIVEMPECALLREVAQELKAFAEGLGEAFGKAFGAPLPNQDQDQEQEQQEEKTKSLPPSASAADKRRRSPDKPPHRISAILTAWDRVHLEELGTAYVRTKAAAEAAQVKRLIAATDKGGMSDTDIEAAMRRFHGDPFWAGKGVIEFCSHFSEFTRDKPKDPRKAQRFTKDDPLFQGMEGFNGFGTNRVEGPRLLEGGVSGGDGGGNLGDASGMARRIS